MKKFVWLPLFLLILQGCAQETTVNLEAAEQRITEESLLRHIEILSSDEFEGRAPATRGEELTVEYIVTQLEELGIDPGMPDGSFVQEFALLGQQVDRETASFVIRRDGNVVGDLQFGSEFMA